jgi:hypothetical protein
MRKVWQACPQDLPWHSVGGKHCEAKLLNTVLRPCLARIGGGILTSVRTIHLGWKNET